MAVAERASPTIVLVPFNGGLAARAALGAACRSAPGDGAEVMALYVVRIPPQVPLGAQLPWLAHEVTPVQLAAQRIGEETGIPVTPDWVCARDIAAGILDAARELRPASIVLGVGDATRLWTRFLPWSLPTRILDRAPCPVILYAVPPHPAGWRLASGAPIR